MLRFKDDSGKPIVDGNVAFHFTIRLIPPLWQKTRAQQLGAHLPPYEEIETQLVYGPDTAGTFDLRPEPHSGEILNPFDETYAGFCMYGEKNEEPRPFDEHPDLSSRLIRRLNNGTLHNGDRCAGCRRYMCDKHLTHPDENGLRLCVSCFDTADELGVNPAQMAGGRIPDFQRTLNFRREQVQLAEQEALIKAYAAKVESENHLRIKNIETELMPLHREVQSTGLLASKAENEGREAQVQLTVKQRELENQKHTLLLERDQMINTHLPEWLQLENAHKVARIHKVAAKTAQTYQAIESSKAEIDLKQQQFTFESESTNRVLDFQEKRNDAEIDAMDRLTGAIVAEKRSAAQLAQHKADISESVSNRQLDLAPTALTHQKDQQIQLTKANIKHMERGDDREDVFVELKGVELENQSRHSVRQHQLGNKQIDMQDRYNQGRLSVDAQKVHLTHQLGVSQIASQERQTDKRLVVQSKGQDIEERLGLRNADVTQQMGLRNADVTENVGFAQSQASRYHADAQRDVGVASVTVENKRVEYNRIISEKQLELDEASLDISRFQLENQIPLKLAEDDAIEGVGATSASRQSSSPRSSMPRPPPASVSPLQELQRQMRVRTPREIANLSKYKPTSGPVKSNAPIRSWQPKQVRGVNEPPIRFNTPKSTSGPIHQFANEAVNESKPESSPEKPAESTANTPLRQTTLDEWGFGKPSPPTFHTESTPSESPTPTDLNSVQTTLDNWMENDSSSDEIIPTESSGATPASNTSPTEHQTTLDPWMSKPLPNSSIDDNHNQSPEILEILDEEPRIP